MGQMAAGQTGTGRVRAAFTGLILVLVLAALWDTLSLGRPAALAPLWVILPCLLLVLTELVRDLRPVSAADAPAEEKGAANRKPIAVEIAWLAVLTGLILLLGVALGVSLFLLVALVGRARLAWWQAALIALSAFVVLSSAVPGV